MRYFYLYPFRKQYYFPYNALENSFLLSFYSPYSSKAKVIWWLYKRSSMVRRIYSIEESELPPKLYDLKKNKYPNSILSFNLGTQGIEQKTTLLGYSQKNGKKFFAKYADTALTKKMVSNEHKILSTLKSNQLAPAVHNFEEKSDYTLLETSFWDGSKYELTALNERVIKLIININSQDLSKKEFNVTSHKDLKLTFAHGDFCPWNIIVKDKELRIIDWEMGGFYPLGYDLFTYVFQTKFLINHNYSIKKIIERNIKHITGYFSNYDIKDWKRYLKAFATIKYNIENNKGGSLSNDYKALKNI